MADQGLTILYTGNGKGKTTAALGQAVRAAGHGFKVCIVQFVKGKWETGEAKAMAAFRGLIDFHTCGSGFTWQQQDMARFAQKAREGWDLARNKIMSGKYDMVILDELTYLVQFEVLTEKDVTDLIKNRPSRLHLVITGRAAGAGLIEAADLVTEMLEIKHPFREGIKARKGIEF